MTYNEKEARELVVRAGHELVKHGLVARTWGNISARISDTHFIITPSGLAYEHLTPEKLVKVQISDCAYEGDIKPSSEKGIHAAAYRHRPEVGFVIHTHQDYASCIGVTGKNLTGLQSDLLGSCVPCASYGMPSTKTLKKGVEEAVAKYPEAKAIFMRHHGAVCMASDFDGAFAVAQELETVCRDAYEKDVKLPQSVTAEEAGNTAKILGEKLLSELALAEPGTHFSLEADSAVLAMAAKNRTMRPFLDDLAQIAGVTIRFAKPEKAAVLKGLKNRNAVMIPGIGAVCCAKDPEDLDAIAAILRKSCMTALYAESKGAAALKGLDCTIMRLVYTMKYSKKKG